LNRTSELQLQVTKKAAAFVANSDDIDAVLILILISASSIGPWNGCRGYMDVIAG
jgi:hypothetical protein